MKSLRRQSALVLLGLFLLAGALASGVVNAQRPGAEFSLDDTPVTIQTEIIIPGSEPVIDDSFIRGKVGDLANYLGIVYKFLIQIVGVVAGVFILVGGIQYMTAGGDAARVSGAKRRIGNAVLGLVLALSSYIILNTINPDLVNLKLPELQGVSTELSFLPFCTNLEKKTGRTAYSVPMEGYYPGSGSCGGAGVVIAQGPDTIENYLAEMAKPEGSRLWCIFQGDPVVARPGEKYTTLAKDSPRPWDCGLSEKADIVRVEICLPNGNVTQRSMEEKYRESLAKGGLPDNWVDKYIKTDGKIYIGAKWDSNGNRIAGTGREMTAEEEQQYKSIGIAPTKFTIARCIACMDITDGTMKAMNLPVGDRACQLWQNVANNNDPLDDTFSLNYKKKNNTIIDFSKPKYESKMYYCGYSLKNATCIYAPIICPNIKSCDDYGDEVTMHYCEKVGEPIYGANGKIIEVPSQTCHSYEELGSTSFKQTGNVRHIIPVCEGNPCDLPGKCTGPLPISGPARTAIRVLSGSLLADIQCE